ncbi:hypothetical protein GCM10009839_58950 [Catenulispora yoronensis]|uniref:Site-specific recombinase XerD n=1 Tax=Catenulispora yoronensis TaxID=450799 RepID=A0ABP5GLG3_9ACTN
MIVRREGDRRYCGTCFRAPEDTCTICGRVRQCYFAGTDQARCESCSSQLNPKECSSCGRLQRITRRMPDGSGLCARCALPDGACEVCGRTAKLRGSSPEGKRWCSSCSTKERRGREGDCAECGGRGQIHRFGLCHSCSYAAGLRELLSGSDGTLRPDLDPVLRALHRGDPASGLNWLSNRAPKTLLPQLAAANGPVTHELLDDLGLSRAVAHIRAVLVTSGVLPQRDEHLARLERWLGEALRQVADPAERRIVKSFATWHHLRRLRRAAETAPVTYSQVNVARRDIQAGIALLGFLRARGSSLATASQAEIDIWLDGTSWMRHLARNFVVWAVRNRHASGIDIPPTQSDLTTVVIENDRRWKLVRRLVDDAQIDLGTRVAGLLLLLFAQPLSRISQLRVEQVGHQNSGVTLAIGEVPLQLPPPLDDLVDELVRHRRGYTAKSSDDDSNPWLFPGALPGQPLTAKRIMHRLQPLGIRARPTRNTTLFELSAELPAVVVSRLLGLNIDTATKWNRRAGATRAAYAAEIARRPRSSERKRSDRS